MILIEHINVHPIYIRKVAYCHYMNTFKFFHYYSPNCSCYPNLFSLNSILDLKVLCVNINNLVIHICLAFCL